MREMKSTIEWNFILYMLELLILKMTQFRILLTIIIFPFTVYPQENNNSHDSIRNIWQDSTGDIEERMNAAKLFYTNYGRSSPDQTIIALETYINLARNVRDKREEAGGLVNLGNVYRDLGEFEQARTNYDMALMLATNLNDKSLYGVVTANIGNLYNDQGNLLPAFKQYSKALRIFIENADTLYTAYMYSSIGNINLKIENFELAEANYIKATEKFSMLGLEANSIIEMNLARIAYEQQDYPKANSQFEECLTQVKLKQDYVLIIGCLQYLTKINVQLNSDEKALFYANEAFKMAIDYANPYLIEETKVELIDSQSDNDWIVSIQESLNNKTEFLSNETKERIYKRLSRIYRDRKEFEKALSTYQREVEYKGLNDSIRSSKLLIAETILLEEKLALEKDRSQEKIETIQTNIRLTAFFFSIIMIMIIVSFLLVRRSKIKRNQLLEQIENLKREQKSLVLTIDEESILKRELIERELNQKLNETDWKVLILLEENPLFSNKDIADKMFLSTEGISSSLRRMYLYFNIGETRYKKIALIMKAIQISKSK